MVSLKSPYLKIEVSKLFRPLCAKPNFPGTTPHSRYQQLISWNKIHRFNHAIASQRVEDGANMLQTDYKLPLKHGLWFEDSGHSAIHYLEEKSICLHLIRHVCMSDVSLYIINIVKRPFKNLVTSLLIRYVHVFSLYNTGKMYVSQIFAKFVQSKIETVTTNA